MFDTLLEQFEELLEQLDAKLEELVDTGELPIESIEVMRDATTAIHTECILCSLPAEAQ